MNQGINGLKNIVWAFGILLALAALAIGLIVAMVSGFSGQRQDGTMQLQAVSGGGSGDTSGEDGQLQGQDSAGGGLRTLPDSQDTGLEYLFQLTFLCDNSFSAVSSYGANFGSTASAQVWLSSSGSLGAADAASTQIVYPQTGASITAASAAQAYAPSRLIVYLGGDGLASTDRDSFVEGYVQLIRGIQSVSPDSQIAICSIGSVTETYSGTDGLTAELVTQAQLWIQEAATETGVYFADLSSVLNDDQGYLDGDYASADGRSLNSAGISAAMSYLRMHAF